MIIFDLDGTLFRTHETCLPALLHTCQRYHLSLTKEDEQFLMYTTPKDLLNRIAPNLSNEQCEQFMHDFKWEEIEDVKCNGRLFEQVEELLNVLSADGIDMAICGMGSKEYIDTVLDRCKIRHFFKYIYHRIDGVSKSQALENLLSKANLSPNECLMVGDSITDLAAAKANEVPFIGVSYGYGAKDIMEALDVAEDVKELQKLIYQHLIFTRIERDILSYKKTFVVGISGVDTSGKTTFSNGLKTYLTRRGFRTQSIHLDDFHNQRAIRLRDDTPKGYIDHAFDLSKLEDLIINLKKNPADIKLNLLALDTDTYTNKQRYITDHNTVIILEGVMLFRPPLDDLIDYKIYLDIDFEEVLCRARIRDVPLYGKAFLQKYIDKYIPAQKTYMKQYTPKEKCQLLIDNNNIQKPVIK